MKAIVFTQYGSPDVLQLKEVTKPVPKDNEVLVKVSAATVNRTDCAILRADPFIMRFVMGLLKPKRTIPGTEFAGTIEAIGKDVANFKVGDRVFGFDDLGVSSLAEYLVIPADKAIATIPENISFSQAAASTEGAHYALNIINKVNIKSGQKILVNGATGAIGSATLQFVKYLGAEVTATGNTKNLALLQSLGADTVIDYTTSDFTQTNQKYDFVFDTVGKSSFGKCKPILKDGGVYISSELGWMAQNVFFALAGPLMPNKKVIFPIPKNIKGSLLFTKKLMEEGKFKAVIDRQYPLEEIADAYRFVETGQKTGNVVVVIGE